MRWKSGRLSGRRIAVLVEDGFEQVELTAPVKALEDEGADVYIVSGAGRKVRAWNHDHWGDRCTVDVSLKEAEPSLFDGLLLPGGVMSPDTLRKDPLALGFVRQFFAVGKPVAAICHAPWTLIDAGVVRGRTLTSARSLKTDLENAGAEWVNREVVVDAGLVTSRGPQDMKPFVRKMIEEFGEGIHWESRDRFLETADEWEPEVEKAGMASGLGKALALAGVSLAMAFVSRKLMKSCAESEETLDYDRQPEYNMYQETELPS